MTISVVCVFFFQAEDGIRDSSVTGVQTCALPILTGAGGTNGFGGGINNSGTLGITNSVVSGNLASDSGGGIFNEGTVALNQSTIGRSEERRVGKECRSRWWPDHLKKKKKKEGESC